MTAFRYCQVVLYNTQLSGSRYIHSYLTKIGIETSLIFFKRLGINDGKIETEKELDLFESLIKNINPDLMGIGVGCSAFYDLATKLTKKAKRIKDIPIIWGGVHATVAPDKCLQHADFACIGEGEEVIGEFIRKYKAKEDVKDIKNIAFKTNGSIKLNQVRPYIKDLDSLPHPIYSNEGKYFINNDSLFEYEPYSTEHEFYLTMTMRGCPFNCAYCANSLFKDIYKGKGSFIRQRSVENVKQELEYTCEMFPDIKQIAFYDDVFGLDQKWTENFCDMYRERFKIPFWCYMHPKSINPNILSKLKSAGLFYIDMGIQSGSERIRREYFKRNDTNKEIIDAVKTLKSYKVKPRLDFILDNPYENDDDRKEVVKLLLSFPKPFEFRLYSLTYFPNTELTKRALKDALITENDVEDVAKKTIIQWHISSDFKRPNKDKFYICLVSLSGKSLIPRFLVRSIMNVKLFEKFPLPIMILNSIANYCRYAVTALKFAVKGELNWNMIKTHIKYVLTINR
jgi:anaerobic magnesium-protoporphyrin IX monomethyl ester cyclase